MARKEGHSNGLDSLLGAGVDCQGTARVEGTLRLDGAFQGTLEVGDTLIIGQSGSFTGRARGRQVIISGRFEGEVLGTEQVELQRGARVDGDILTRSFVIEPGVWFQGQCRMDLTDADEARLQMEPAPEAAPEQRRGEGAVVRSLGH
jgi:cytoskeletal protein CcmA (bactofilin family)